MPRKEGSQVCFSSLLFTVTEQDAAPGSNTVVALFRDLRRYDRLSRARPEVTERIREVVREHPRRARMVAKHAAKRAVTGPFCCNMASIKI